MDSLDDTRPSGGSATEELGSLGGTAQTLVEIDEASLCEIDEATVSNRWLELPRTVGEAPVGTTSSTYALEIEGWVVGSRFPIEAVELVHDGASLWRVPLTRRPDVAAAHPDAPHAERSGFYAIVSSLALAFDFELLVRAVGADDARADIAVVRGRRAPLRCTVDPAFNPLLITTLGRSGSTALLKLFASHPQIVAHSPVQGETRVASYWLDILRGLAEPASYLQQISPPRGMPERWWTGTQMVPRRDRDPAANQWMGATSVEALAAFCQRQIDAFYESASNQEGNSDAVYFAEKCQPGGLRGVPELVSEIYRNGREVVLVRDFRDMACSMSAYNRKLGFQGFGRSADASDEENLAWVRDIVTDLHNRWRQLGERGYLLRYEDLILHPVETLGSVLEFLDIDCSNPTISRMLDELSDTGLLEIHQTSDGVKASIGRWRHDLTPEVQQLYSRELGPFLEAFGYEAE
jgi:Sulfotransferase family